jgi:hypothetical protein
MTWSISILFGLIPGLAPLGLRLLLASFLPRIAYMAPVALAHAFLDRFDRE